MAKILDGRVVRDAVASRLSQEIAKLKEKPILAIIQVGDRADSTAYVNAKKKFGEKIGVIVKHIHLPEKVSQTEVIAEIEKLNRDQNISGIIVQLPLPDGLEKRAILDTINPLKDVDGITRSNIEKRQKGLPDAVWPATARGVRELLEFYKISLKDKKVCVIGRSELVGTPIAELCRSLGVTVTVCHSQTVDLAKETLAADIIISAVGKIGLISAKNVRAGQVVIDVGINTLAGERLEEEISRRKIVGDVDFEAVKNIVSAISPVPGGVGPMTVSALFENLLEIYKDQTS